MRTSGIVWGSQVPFVVVSDVKDWKVSEWIQLISLINQIASLVNINQVKEVRLSWRAV